MDEFDIINTYFAPLTRGYAGSDHLRDDAAVLCIPANHELVVTSDTLNEGVHFLSGEAPASIARKALRVNVSDLASMGAKPLCYQLNIAFPHKPETSWLSAFSKALQSDNKEYDIFCSGGDTTSIKGNALSISITAMGLVRTGQAIRRRGAKDGDYAVVTGYLGDAVLGLACLQTGDEDIQKSYKAAIEKHRVPQPRPYLYEALRHYANAAADISDGVLQDSLNIATASGLGVEIDCLKIPFSKDVQAAIKNKVISPEKALLGGDDYELIMAVSEKNLENIGVEFKKFDLNHTVIGQFRKNISGLSITNNETYCIDYKSIGWKHF